METKLILLDMDEVICDFIGGVCRLWGFSRADLESCRMPKEWDIEPAMSRLLGTTVSKTMFWNQINAAGYQFWSELEQLPWADDLILLLDRRNIPYHIVTGPSLCPTSYDGKVKWIKRRFGKTFDRFAITPHKELFANPHSCLIDDRALNCDKFAAAGGNFILFPSQSNTYADYATDPVSFLRQHPLFEGF